MKKDRFLSGFLSLLYALSLFLFILSFSIGLPIYIRPFYYVHIDALGLEKVSGYSEEQIRTAYDQVMDYLTLPGREFSVGDMPYSQEGAAHFADCKVLFDLNAGVLLVSVAFLAVLLILSGRGKTGPYRLGNRTASYWAALAVVILPVAVGLLAVLDFDRAFALFHNVLFPGKDNWLFDRQADPIIRVLPQQFFMNCAILIGICMLSLALFFLLKEWRRSVNEKKATLMK